MPKRTVKVVQQYWDASVNAIVTVYAAGRMRKQVTAKASKSLAHCGRTNVYGLSV